jgi:hypothetical protein
MPTTFAPLTRHSVVCGICDAVAECTSNTILRGITFDAYVGTEVVEASVALALPAGWVFRDFGVDVAFVCGTCSLDERAQDH